MFKKRPATEGDPKPYIMPAEHVTGQVVVVNDYLIGNDVIGDIVHVYAVIFHYHHQDYLYLPGEGEEHVMGALASAGGWVTLPQAQLIPMAWVDSLASRPQGAPAIENKPF